MLIRTEIHVDFPSRTAVLDIGRVTSDYFVLAGEMGIFGSTVSTIGRILGELSLTLAEI